jgi:hypothetical protein
MPVGAKGCSLRPAAFGFVLPTFRVWFGMTVFLWFLRALRVSVFSVLKEVLAYDSNFGSRAEAP